MRHIPQAAWPPPVGWHLRSDTPHCARWAPAETEGLQGGGLHGKDPRGEYGLVDAEEPTGDDDGGL